MEMIILNILMLVNNSASFKIYQELKQYLLVYDYIPNEVNLAYYYIPMKVLFYYDKKQIIPELDFNMKDFFYSYNIQTDYSYKDLYACKSTANINYLLQIVHNYINNKPLDNNLDTVSWIGNKYIYNNQNRKLYTFNDILELADKIPQADIYLINYLPGAAFVVQFLIAIYLIKKFNAYVLIGGGKNLNNTNPETQLVNAIGHSYLDNKLFKCSGAIGPTVVDFLNNRPFLNSYIDIHEYFKKPWYINLSDFEVSTICENDIYISTSYGCTGHCPYCVGSNLHSFTELESLDYYKDILLYLSKHYPNSRVTFYDTELNRNKDRFNSFIEWLKDNNISNKVNFYINLQYIDDISLDILPHINIGDIRSAFDGIFERFNNRNKYNINKDPYLIKFKQLKDVIKKQKGTLFMNSILFIPGSSDLKKYKEDPMFAEQVAKAHVLYAFDLTFEINMYGLMFNSDMFFNKDKYNIKIVNYENNRFKDLKDIANEVNNIPAFYTYDFTRRDRTHAMHSMLNVWKDNAFLTFDNKLQSNSSREFRYLGYILLNDLIDEYSIHDDVVHFLLKYTKEYQPCL